MILVGLRLNNKTKTINSLAILGGILTMDDIRCDACGISMMDEDGTAVMIGLQIKAIGEHRMVDELLKAFGKSKFHICHVCWVKSLGVELVKERDRTKLCGNCAHNVKGECAYYHVCRDFSHWKGD